MSVRMLHSTAQEGAPISLSPYLQQILFKVLLKPIKEEVSQWNHSFCRTERERELAVTTSRFVSDLLCDKRVAFGTLV